jgi:hypothetical protein
MIAAYIRGTAANVSFSGLAPGFAGVYQLNITVPAGLPAGDDYLEIQGPDSDTVEAGISIGSGSTAAAQGANAQGLSTADQPVASKQLRRVHRSPLHRTLAVPE